jgi:ribonucleoside-diphosphate reductase alpha chain
MLRVFNATSRYVNQCFTPETVVHTLAGPRQIKNVSTNDMVLTIDGSYMPVNEVITNHVQKEILEIDTDFSVSPTRCTKEHEVFTVTRINKY